mmetsp:Transcript_39791/g.104067  ORF Transcript_39791/g.104067 Transcript_39791/m.104067 type:complete len:208 (-) Transcript_39791:2219-2842(-)
MDLPDITFAGTGGSRDFLLREGIDELKRLDTLLLHLAASLVAALPFAPIGPNAHWVVALARLAIARADFRRGHGVTRCSTIQRLHQDLPCSRPLSTVAVRTARTPLAPVRPLAVHRCLARELVARRDLLGCVRTGLSRATKLLNHLAAPPLLSASAVFGAQRPLAPIPNNAILVVLLHAGLVVACLDLHKGTGSGVLVTRATRLATP